MSTTTTITDHDFRDIVLGADEPTLITFWAAWCQQSLDLLPLVEKLGEQYDGRVKVLSVDAEKDTGAIRRHLGIDRIPATALFDRGQMVDLVGGAASARTLTEMVERRLEPVLDIAAHEFEREVVRSPVPTLVQFWAAWCDVSLKLDPLIRRTAEKFGRNTKVVRLEWGPESAELAARYDVHRVPTTALFVDGRPVDRILGGTVDGPSGQSGAGLVEMVGRYAL